MHYHSAGDWQQSGQRCAVLQTPALRSADGQSVSKKLEQFCMAGRGRPCVVGDGDPPTPHLVHFQGRTELQKWLKLGVVDFAEIFRGFGEATVRVREAGCTPRKASTSTRSRTSGAGTYTGKRTSATARGCLSIA